MTTPTETFQISLQAAEAYENTFVPALFGGWAVALVDVAAVSSDAAVLDVACGTGIVARTVADRLDIDGSVVGVDLNDAMLTVARRLRPDIEWRQADAAALPFSDATFDAVLCQSALMFFPDPVVALREMARVVRTSGSVAVQVWGALDDQPAYRLFVDAAAEVAGPDAVDLLSAYWTLGDEGVRRALFEHSGLGVTSTVTRTGTIRFPSLEQFVRVEVEATPLIDRVDEDTYGRLRERAVEVLQPYQTDDGHADIPIVGHIITAQP
jgi:SAM-dependent methyltransferase